ncbi:MAG: 50S ribosome-binding GTPase [Candidatus Nanoarchaeia archaeon]|nr:50S ribosome-binding GTPase [Candidatus Nanoarchaeia archaeon]MDD5358056.1 50S ribosome-binding GTPase [Candidatus Nanoarchaeia archaeon]MDD5589244.1 50S ribosome-binding GTPase [Candidatus Nanoarchaeia archaeon]
MASTNQSPFYQKAESKFLNAQTDEERLMYLEEMMRECPKHKSSEKMLANIKTRYTKLKKKIETERKTKKSSARVGIKKEDLQAVIVGKTKSGKSSLISLLTNAKPKISSYDFETKFPIIGMMDYNGVPIQMIEVPAIESEYYDRGIVNSADTVLILITDLSQLPEIEKKIERAPGKRIILVGKTDLLSENEKRKISATLQSKKYNFVLVSAKAGENIEQFKEKLFQSFGKIRVYTKEPGKPKSNRPIILLPESTVKNVAEKILKGFSSKIKETRIWGPSSKYPGQVVGLKHEMKDMDVVEFKTR